MTTPLRPASVVSTARVAGIALVAGTACILAAAGCSESREGAPADEPAAASPSEGAAEGVARAEGGSPSGDLGPVDGHDLPPVDLDRVQVGDTAPDFALQSYDDGVVALSDFRGEKDVVLVFYRGHW